MIPILMGTRHQTVNHISTTIARVTSLTIKSSTRRVAVVAQPGMSCYLCNQVGQASLRPRTSSLLDRTGTSLITLSLLEPRVVAKPKKTHCSLLIEEIRSVRRSSQVITVSCDKDRTSSSRASMTLHHLQISRIQTGTHSDLTATDLSFKSQGRTSNKTRTVHLDTTAILLLMKTLAPLVR